jgi:capsular polysaccharide transport system permease protein
MSEKIDSQIRIPARLRFQTLRVIVALILREMNTTHGRSPGGYIWAILEPVAGIAVMTLIFGLFLRAPPMGSSFAVYYATGLLPFAIYSDIAGKVAQTIRFSRPLLVYPKVTFLDAVIARFVLNCLTQLLVFYIVIASVFLFESLSIILNYTDIILSIALAAFLGLSIGSVNSLLFSFFPIWEKVWGVINRPMLLISCVFYTFESVPDSVKWIVWFNPIAHILGLMRKGFYEDANTDYVSIPYVLLWCFIPAAFGVYFLRVYHKKILTEV